MGRQRVYADAAAHKRASRAREGDGGRAAETAPRGPRAGQNIVTGLQGKNNRHGHDMTGLVAPVGASQGQAGGVYQHTTAAGLLVRVEADLTGGRVRATVLEPGQSGLLPGTAYPFRLDLLNEVHA